MNLQEQLQRFASYPNDADPAGIPNLSVGGVNAGRLPVSKEVGRTGQVFYVDPVNGSTGNTGRSPSTAFSTTTQALAACTSGNGDIIYRLPGLELLTAPVVVNKTGVSIIAAPYKTTFNTPTDYLYYSSTGNSTGPVFQVTHKAYLYGLATYGIWSAGCDVQVVQSTGSDPSGSVLEKCLIYGAASNYGLSLEGVNKCSFLECTISGTDAILMTKAASTEVANNLFRGCEIIGATNAVEKSTGSTGTPDGNVWEECLISGVVDNNAANLVQYFLDCKINATGVDGFMDVTTTGYTSTVAIGNVYTD